MNWKIMQAAAFIFISHPAFAQATVPDWQAALNALSAAITAQQQQITTLQQQIASCFSTPPSPPTVAESPDGTFLNPGPGQIVDANLAVWTLPASLVIQKNGANAFDGWQAFQLEYKTHTVFMLGMDHKWYKWNGNSFTGPLSGTPQ